MNLLYSLSSQNPDLSKSQIEGILYLILNSQEMTNSALIRETGLPKEALRRFKQSISSLLEKPESDEILFKLENRSRLEKLNLNPYFWTLVGFEDPKLEVDLGKIREKYKLTPKREYDQFFATVNTSVAKVKVMGARGDIEGKRIALLGDDDLLSVVLGLQGKGYDQITVLDVDEDILSAISRIVEENGFKNIRTELYDARESLRPDLKGRFDIVVTDPPYTAGGVRLFLERSLELLGASAGKKIYFYYGSSFKTREKTMQIQEILAHYNLLINEKIDKFARYHGAESMGSASSLYLLETLNSTRQPLEKPVENIYTYQSRHKSEFPFVEHFVFKLYEVPKRVVTSKTYLQKALGQFCKYHRLKVVDTEVVRFPGGGFTFNYTLASSSLTAHTWPEMNAIHVVLVTCSPLSKPDRLYENLSLLFKTQKIEVDKVE